MNQEAGHAVRMYPYTKTKNIFTLSHSRYFSLSSSLPLGRRLKRFIRDNFQSVFSGPQIFSTEAGSINPGSILGSITVHLFGLNHLSLYIYLVYLCL